MRPLERLLGHPEPGPWTSYPAGTSFLRHLASGDAPAASWLALPGQQGTPTGRPRWPWRLRPRWPQDGVP